MFIFRHTLDFNNSRAGRPAVGVLTLSCKNVRKSAHQGEGNKAANLISIPWPLCCFLLWSTWYSSFMGSKKGLFSLSLPDKLSRNIKDSLTAVMPKLILECHSDVSRPVMNSFFACSSVWWLEFCWYHNEKHSRPAMWSNANCFNCLLYIKLIYNGATETLSSCIPARKHWLLVVVFSLFFLFFCGLI